MLSFKPITSHLPEILELIENNKIVKIVGPPGIGKSSLLPKAIASTGKSVITVVSDSILSDDMVTSKQMKEMLYKGPIDIDVIILDELDKGSRDNYLILSLYRYYVEHNNYSAKLVLLSNQDYNMLFQNSPTYTIENNVSNVNNVSNIDIRYNDRNYNVRSEMIYLVSDTLDLIYDMHNSSLSGDFLIFTSGEVQVESMLKNLKAMELSNVELYGIYSSDRKDLYKNTDKRKIILASEIAETSVTLDNISLVIDMMTGLESELTLTGGYRFPIKYITKEKADRRARRGGISRDSICYRMITSEMYKNLKLSSVEEIYRFPVHITILELIQNNLDPFIILENIPNLNYTYNLLLKEGLIDVLNKITPAGEFVSSLPYGLRQGSALYKYYKTGEDLFPAILVLSMIDNFGYPDKQGYYVYPLREEYETIAEYNIRKLEHIERYLIPFSGSSDIETYSNIWSIMLDEIENFSGPSSQIIQWSRENSLNPNKMLDIKHISQNIMHLIGLEYDEPIQTGPFNTHDLLNVLGPILADIYSDQLFRLNPESQIRCLYQDASLDIYSIDPTLSLNTINTDFPSKVFGLITSRINSNIGKFNTITCSLVE